MKKIKSHPYDAGYPRDDSKGCIAERGGGRETACGRAEKDHESSEYPKTPSAERNLGTVPTGTLIQELQLRGDIALTVQTPGCVRAVDGVALSALAGVLLRSSHQTTLEARRGE